MTNLDSVLKRRGVIFPTNICIVKVMIFPTVMYGCESWRIKNAELDEAQAGIKITGRNINNLRYADDTLMVENKEELKSFLMKVKEESEKTDKTQYSKN